MKGKCDNVSKLPILGNTDLSNCAVIRKFNLILFSRFAFKVYDIDNDGYIAVDELFTVSTM